MTRSMTGRQAFTLVEMMVTIAIFGILLTVAVFAYQRYVGTARTQEVVSITADIAGRQQQYFARYSRYVDTGTANDFWPQTVDGSSRPWGIDCSGVLTAIQKTWCQLGVKVTGSVFYQYNTQGWNESKGASDVPGGLGIPTNETWWLVVARGDMDKDGVYSTFRIHSHSGGRLQIINELE